ncbi:MAG: hypothetical protein HW416_2193 [Chloroflexi bacterium]|nr:hypothetical protein [Chloroflexota bacterium]
MLYPAERGASTVRVDRMEQIANAVAADPASAVALDLLREAGVSHVFLGSRGGPISEPKLAGSGSYGLVYRSGGVAIYELLGLPCAEVC